MKTAGKLLRWAFRLIVLVLLVAGWGLAALAVHVVVVPDEANPESFRLVVVPKNTLSVEDTYVDTRNWTAADAQAHPELINRLIEADKADQLSHVLETSLRRQLDEMLERRTEALVGSVSRE